MALPAITTLQVFPGANAVNPFTFAGYQNPQSGVTQSRTYSCAVGSVITVPAGDVPQLVANGWICSARGGVGPTSARPKEPGLPAGSSGQPIGVEYIDTTLGQLIVYSGTGATGWVNPATGASV